MTIDNINTLIVADESRTLELKKTTGELKVVCTHLVHSLIPKVDVISLTYSMPAWFSSSNWEVIK